MACRHLIQRQTLDIALDRQESFLPMQNRLSQCCRDEMKPLMDTLCSAASVDGQIYRIDRLEVDLGEISDVDLEKTFLEQFQQLFPAVLHDHIVKIEQASGSTPKRDVSASKKASLTDMDFVGESRSNEMARLEAFIFFIKTGMMPWWYAESSAQPDQIFSELLVNNKKQLGEYLQPVLSQATARERFIRQIPIALLSQYIVLFLDAAQQSQFLAMVEDITLITERQTILAAKTWNYIIWHELIRLSLVDKHRIDMKGLAERLMMRCAQQAGKKYGHTVKAMHALVRQSKQSGVIFKSELPEWIESVMKDPPGISGNEWIGVATAADAFQRQQSGTRERLFNHDGFEHVANSDGECVSRPGSRSDGSSDAIGSDAVHSGSTRLDSTHSSSIHSDGLMELASGQPAIITGADLNAERQQTSAVDSADEDNDLARHGSHIAFAGQVILWPYLKHYFTALNLIKHDCFVAELTRMRAVHLLQYLAAEQQQTAECHLMLNKILCGWPVDRPLDDGIVLSRHEKMESQALLSTLISHWSALKNTSIEGLRESFLKRNGQLTRTESGWRLRVERKAHDMLLEQLPWTLSIIHLSWMKQALFVEW